MALLELDQLEIDFRTQDAWLRAVDGVSLTLVEGDTVPQLDAEVERLSSIPGSVPHLGSWAAACRFHPRCGQAQEACGVVAPGLERVSNSTSHDVRCPFWRE